MRNLILLLSCILLVSVTSAQVTTKQNSGAVKSTAAMSSNKAVVINESAKNDVTVMFDRMSQELAEAYKELMGQVRSQIEAIEQNISKINQQIDALKAQADKINKSDPDREKKVQSIQAQIENLSNQKAAYLKKITALNEQMEKVEKELKAALADLDQKEKKAAQEASAAKTKSATEYQATLKGIDTKNTQLVNDRIHTAQSTYRKKVD